jgi:hypothetical protein
MCRKERRLAVDQEAMVTKTLTENMIRSGAALVAMLDKRGLAPDAALWFYFPDIGEWKLVLAEVKLSHQGPRVFYKLIQDAISKADPQLKEVSLDSVALAVPNAPIISLLSSAVQTGPGISGIRFTNNVVNGTVVEDAYIYRLTSKSGGDEKRGYSAGQSDR